jgi:hypothetical protein
MIIKYEEIVSPISGNKVISADLENGIVLSIPSDPANSDYQRYLRWLEDPTAEEGGTLS